MTPGRRPTLAQCALFVVCLLLVFGAIDVALAQPFGISRSSVPPQFGPFAGWILAKQAEFYRMLSGSIRAAKADGSAAWGLMGISFAYGVFHAAGPGHGKAVISSYLVANDETWRRGIALSFASAMLQAFTAVAIVGIAAVLLGATAHVMGNAVRAIEMVSYALIILIGLRLLWVKGRAFLRLLRTERHEHREHAHHKHDHGHSHAHGHDRAHGHDHAHDHDHEDEAHAWGHAHAPEPSEFKGPHWLRRGLIGHRRGRSAAVLGRHHRAGVRAGAGPVLDRRRLDLRHGARHRDHRRRRRHASRSPRAALPGGWPRASRAPACCCCAAWRRRPPS